MLILPCRQGTYLKYSQVILEVQVLILPCRLGTYLKYSQVILEVQVLISHQNVINTWKWHRKKTVSISKEVVKKEGPMQPAYSHWANQRS